MKKFLMIIGLALMLVPSFAQNHTDYKLPDEPKRGKYIDFPSLDKGFWFAVQATPAIGLGRAGGFWASADFIAGYRTGEFLKVGVGVSPRFDGIAGFALPLYLDLRGNIISQESRMAVPYWNVDAGWTFFENGIYVSPTVGVRVGMPRNNLIAGLTYIFQHASIPYGNFSAIGLRVGYEF